MEYLIVGLSAVITVVTLIMVIDVMRRSNRNIKKTDELFVKLSVAIDNIVRERKLEHEKEEQCKEEAETVIAGPSEPEVTIDLPDDEHHDHDLDHKFSQNDHNEDVFGKNYIIPFEECYSFPAISPDGMPSQCLLPIQVVDAIRKEFSLPADNSRLIDMKTLQTYLQQNSINIGITYPAVEDSDKKASYFVTSEGEERFNFNDQLVSTIESTSSNKLVIRFMDGNKVQAKICHDMGLYKSYVAKFGSVMNSKMPDADQFVEWYSNAIDDFARLYDENDRPL